MPAFIRFIFVFLIPSSSFLCLPFLCNAESGAPRSRDKLANFHPISLFCRFKVGNYSWSYFPHSDILYNCHPCLAKIVYIEHVVDV